MLVSHANVNVINETFDYLTQIFCLISRQYINMICFKINNNHNSFNTYECRLVDASIC